MALSPLGVLSTTKPSDSIRIHIMRLLIRVHPGKSAASAIACSRVYTGNPKSDMYIGSIVGVAVALVI